MGWKRRMYCALDGQENSTEGEAVHHEKLEVDEEGQHWKEVNQVLGRVDENAEMCWSPNGPLMLVLQILKRFDPVLPERKHIERNNVPWIANNSIMTTPIPNPFSPSARHSISSLPVTCVPATNRPSPGVIESFIFG
jgi:hypothetical protein